MSRDELPGNGGEDIAIIEGCGYLDDLLLASWIGTLGGGSQRITGFCPGSGKVVRWIASNGQLSRPPPVPVADSPRFCAGWLDD
jgi:hypothetical protein